MSWIGWTRIISIIILIIWIICYRYLFYITYGSNKYGYKDKNSENSKTKVKFPRWMLILCIISIYIPIVNIIVTSVLPERFLGITSERYDGIRFHVINGDKFSENFVKIIKWLQNGI